MAPLLTLLTVVGVLFSIVVRCDEAQEDFLRRNPALVGRSGSQWEAQLFISNDSEQSGQLPFSTPHDGRSLLASWLGTRQETCVNSGYSPCTDGSGCCPTSGYGCCPLGCCPTGKNCCKNSNSCVEPGGACCEGDFTCPSGWNCCVSGTCYPNGGQCCSTGFYCTPGNICVLVKGVQKCCTDNTCTAHVSGTQTITLAALPTNTDADLTVAAPPTTAAPTQNTLIVQWTYYTYTITWFYYSWYWTVEFESFTDSTYTKITTTTVVSVYATDSFAASDSFFDLSLSLDYPTPAAATSLSPLPSSTEAATTQTGGAGFTINTSLRAGDTIAGTATRSTTVTTATTAATVSSVGQAAGNSGAIALRAGLGERWVMGGLIGVFVGLGGLMVWL